MSDVEEEIASQPACWRRSVELAPSLAPRLPARGQRVAFVGCGTSLYAARICAALWEGAGMGEGDAFAASEVPARPYDVVVLLSRSGTTTEVLQAADRLSGTRTIAVTAAADSAIVDRATEAIVLDHAFERSVVQTRFPTSVVALVRAVVGEDLGPAIADAEHAVSLPSPFEPGRFEQFVFLGRGWAAGLADEAALKCRESAGLWAESYPSMELRHGPLSAVGAASVVWPLDALPPGLAGDIAATGATIVPGAGLDPLAELIRIQRVAVAHASFRGLDPDRPPHLAFSVVLDG